jgi:hypothetical protein
MLPRPALGHPPIAITPDKVEIYPEKRCSPWAASLTGGVRGSFSKRPQRINEYITKISIKPKIL